MSNTDTRKRAINKDKKGWRERERSTVLTALPLAEACRRRYCLRNASFTTTNPLLLPCVIKSDLGHQSRRYKEAPIAYS